jgi:pimeloyl-ACP methyl ester carboxylesterase
MGVGNESVGREHGALGPVKGLGGLAVDDVGDADARPPLVLLHGLTFDRTMWQPTLTELARIDPGRRALVLDLPGHGQSSGWESYDATASPTACIALLSKRA